MWAYMLFFFDFLWSEQLKPWQFSASREPSTLVPFGKWINSSQIAILVTVVQDLFLMLKHNYLPFTDRSPCSILQTKLYTEDWIGLRTLDKAGKVKFVSVPGKHLGISQQDMQRYVVPYLKDYASTRKPRLNRKFVKNKKMEKAVPKFKEEPSVAALLNGSSSYWWPPSVKTFFAEMLGLVEESSWEKKSFWHAGFKKNENKNSVKWCRSRSRVLTRIIYVKLVEHTTRKCDILMETKLTGIMGKKLFESLVKSILQIIRYLHNKNV